MRMKKESLFNIVLAGMLAVASCGCNDKEQEPQQTPDQEQTGDTDDPQPGPEDDDDNVTDDKVVGTWTLSSISINIGMPPQPITSAEEFDTALGQLLNMIYPEANLTGECVFASTITCNANHSFSMEIDCENPLITSGEGTWAIEGENIVFTMDSESDNLSTVYSNGNIVVTGEFEINNGNTGNYWIEFAK